MVAGRQGSRRLVVAADAIAQTLGVEPGMVVAQAQATVPRLAVVDADPDADAAALTRLATWAAKRFSPWAAACPPDGLWIEATGCAHLLGGEERMLATIGREIARAGFNARAVLADTPGAAYAVARFSSATCVVVPAGAGRNALASFPVAALRLDDATVDGLRRLGFSTIGQLYGVPRAPLTKRFGLELFRRLDQALGDAPEPIDYPLPTNLPRSEVRLAEPISTADALAHIIEKLVQDLCVELEARRLGARQLDLRFVRVDNDHQTITARTAKASREPAHLTKLLVLLIETIDPGFGIEAATLIATVTEPLAPAQLGTGAEPPEPDLAELLDRLSVRLGDRKLYRLAPVESDVPERAARRVAPLAPPAGGTWPYADMRPARLLTPPEPIEVTSMLPDHPPRQFRWRGQLHRVARADGPEVIHGEWWRSDAEVGAARDYFVVEVADGRRFWVFRRRDELASAAGPARWYLHGVFG